MTCTIVLQHVEPARTRAEAVEMVEGLRLQEGCLGARVIGDGNRKPWAAQGFFEDAPGVEWFPDGTRRVHCPDSLLQGGSSR